MPGNGRLFGESSQGFSVPAFSGMGSQFKPGFSLSGYVKL
jgi:hypothetical protein